MRYLLVLSLIFAFGCEVKIDESETVSGDTSAAGGEAGENGQGGDSGSSGENGEGGNEGGVAGTGGQGGNSGSSGEAGNAGSGGESGTAGSGGEAGGAAGSGGDAGTGGDAGDGGAAGQGGDAGMGGSTVNLCENAGGICRENPQCESGERRIRTPCGNSGLACCMPDGQCMDTDQDGACDLIDRHCNTDGVPLACRLQEPNCELNTVPEVRGGCFTNRCVTWGECVYDPTEESRCTGNSDCEPGERCDAGGCLECICEMGPSVCGADGRTYPSQCAARCVNVEVIAEDSCSASLSSCGGFAGTACASASDTCVDNPDDNCDPSNGGSDCMGICLPAPVVSCTVDTDCPSGQWCRTLENMTDLVCVPFASEGDSCGGFTLPWTFERCGSGLQCASVDPLLVDAPGICRRSCANSSECDMAQYCALDSICRPDGSCVVNADCELSGNVYPRPLCLGRGRCNRNEQGMTCGWLCDSDFEPDDNRDER